MALNCLKKGCTNAVRMAIVVLQGLVIILSGLKIVRDHRRAMVREVAQEDPVQEERCTRLRGAEVGGGYVLWALRAAVS